MKLQKPILWLVFAVALVFGAREASAAEVVKIGTLAPEASPWGKVFKAWIKAAAEKSGNKLDIQFFFNGQQGDEAAMVTKIKSGQIDGAAITAVGLGKVHKPILALQMPGVLTDWTKLDKARDALKGEFEKGASGAGFTILGWGDVGLVRTITKGFALKTPDDVKGKKPYVWRDDEISPKVYQAIGGVTAVPLNVPEVLSNLNTGAVNVVNVPALVAEQLQWAPKLDQISDAVSACAVGALVMSSKKLDALPADLKTIMKDTGSAAGSALTKRIRDEDSLAWGRLKVKMTVFTPDAAKWNAIFKQVRTKLGQGTFSTDLIAKIEKHG